MLVGLHFATLGCAHSRSFQYEMSMPLNLIPLILYFRLYKIAGKLTFFFLKAIFYTIGQRLKKDLSCIYSFIFKKICLQSKTKRPLKYFRTIKKIKKNRGGSQPHSNTRLEITARYFIMVMS